MHFFASISTETYKNTSNPLHEYFRNREHWTKNTVSNKSFILVNIHCRHPLFIYDQLDLASVSYWYVTAQKPNMFFMRF